MKEEAAMESTSSVSEMLNKVDDLWRQLAYQTEPDKRSETLERISKFCGSIASVTKDQARKLLVKAGNHLASLPSSSHASVTTLDDETAVVVVPVYTSTELPKDMTFKEAKRLGGQLLVRDFDNALVEFPAIKNPDDGSAHRQWVTVK